MSDIVLGRGGPHNSYLIDQLGSDLSMVLSGEIETLVTEVTVNLPERVLSILDQPLPFVHSSLLTPRDHDRLYLVPLLLAQFYGIDSNLDEFVEMLSELVTGYVLYTVRDKLRDGELTLDKISDLGVVDRLESMFGENMMGHEMKNPIVDRGTYLNSLYDRYRLYGETVSQTIGRCYILSGKGSDLPQPRSKFKKEQNVRDLSQISTYSTLWLIVQQLSDDLVDWAEDLPMRIGVWHGVTMGDINVRGLLKVLPIRLQEIDVISRMISSIPTSELGLQALYYWLMERESSWVSDKLENIKGLVKFRI